MVHLPNASIDFNKLHKAAVAADGKLDAVPEHAIVIGEQEGPNHTDDAPAAAPAPAAKADEPAPTKPTRS